MKSFQTKLKKLWFFKKFVTQKIISVKVKKYIQLTPNPFSLVQLYVYISLKKHIQLEKHL